MTDTRQLLADYVASGSETAFRDLVASYVDLVYSAAIRLVNGDTHLAEDVAQTVFADLAKLARTLPKEVMLGGWLHRHTCFVASKVLRGERRRLERERQAVAMNTQEDHSAANLATLTPVLDEAVNQLSAEDRAAILLRFFEQKDFRSVGESLGSTEEAARKRVDRALEKLQGLLKVRGVTLSGTALASALAALSVSAAPVGFAVAASSFALASAATGAGTTLTILEIMSMTKLKVAVITAVVVAGVAIPWVMQQQTQTKLTEANDALRQQRQQSEQLAAENVRLAKLTAMPTAAPVATNNSSHELLRLRGEVARLRQDAASRTNGPSALSGLKADQAMWQTIREQQKMGMGMLYKDFTKKLNLPKEQTDKFSELLADDVMENIDHITAVLRDGLTPQQMEPIFAGQEAALLEKVQTLLGDEALGQYQEYSKRLASNISAEQFKGMMTGEKEEKDAKARQFYDIMLAETAQALADAGLPANYQTLPIMNFRNIASESEEEKNLKLLDSIYQKTAKRATFLTPEEVAQFAEFRNKAINNQRMVLRMNRTMMSPGGR